MRRVPVPSPPHSPPPSLHDEDEDLPSLEDEDPPLPDDDEIAENPPTEDDFFGDPPSEEFEDNLPSDPEDVDFDEPLPDEDEDEDLPNPVSPEDSFDDDPPPKQKNSFVLPVTTVNRSKADKEDSSEGTRHPRVEHLTVGLIVKDPPQLLNKQALKVETSPSFSLPSTTPKQGVVVQEHEANSGLHIATSILDASSEKRTRRESLTRQGYIDVKGRFDGDSFENLFLMISKESKVMTVVVESGESAVFDLSKRAFVFEDVEDPTTLILDYHQNIIIFKFATTESLFNVMKNMPEEVFKAADIFEEEEEELEVVKGEEKKSNSAVSKANTLKSTKSYGTGPKIDHVKGTSVEDILENDFETTAERQEKIDQMFQTRDPGGSQQVPAPKRRKELIETYIRKPKYSVRRVTLICEWVNTLNLWPRRLTILTLHREICNGILLGNIFKHLKPDVVYLNMHDKAMVKKAAISNLEQVLGHIWRSKSLNNSRIPSAEEIYSGNTSKTAILLNELFAVYILRPLYKSALKILRWYHNILKQYQRPLPNYVFDEGDLAGVWPHFQSGTALFCVIYHFYGATSIGRGSSVHHVDPLRIAGDPTSICDFRSNLTYVFFLLEILGIDVLWTAEDWISNPDTEFIMFQLFIIYDTLKEKQCTLPPAHGDKPGLTSGPNGEALVIGLIFSDAPANIKFLPKTRKAVRLGHDDDSMPLLPVDQSFLRTRFTAGGTLPQGMISKNAKIAQISVDLKESKLYGDRNNWNARTTVNTSKDNFDGAHLESLLREHHKQHLENLEGSTASQNVAFTKSVSQPNLKRTSQVVGGTQSLNIGKSDSSATHSEFLRPYQDISKEINQMVKLLEDEMKSAREKIKEFEEDLADRYQQLEESAHACTAVEYEMALEDLDKERTDLEMEKKRLQDYFTRKFAFIRERKDSAQAVQQAAFSEITLSQQRLENSSNNRVTGKSQSVFKREVKSALNPKSAEKGWINLSSAKLETHNFHLRNKQSLSIANFKAKITPKNLLERDKLEQQISTSKSKNVRDQDVSSSQNYSNELKDFPQDFSGEIPIENSFRKFKYRLHLCTTRFLDSKQLRNRPSIQDIMNASPKTQRIELISLPVKYLTEAENLSSDQDSSSKMIRSDELRMMNYEDERRKMLFAERSLEQSLNLSQQLFQNATAFPSNHLQTSSPTNVAFNQGFDAIEDIDSAFAFLAKPRILIMNDRSKKEYNFALTNLSQENFSGEEVKFAFEWNPLQDVEVLQHNLSGLVLIEDILSVQVSVQDSSVLVITLRETGRALKNSKGRTTISIRCPSSLEALSYVTSLSMVVRLCVG